MTNRYFSLVKEGSEANINIYGDITAYPFMENDVSSFNLSKQLDELTDVSQINVYVNSYGGDVSEGIAIHNALKRHKAKVKTVCDGFACSIASVIWCAGDERVMNEASMLMIHQAWTWLSGNADDLRKQADNLDKITQMSVDIYSKVTGLDEKTINKMMKAETWISPQEALEMGFATSIESYESDKPSQNTRKKLFNLFVNALKAEIDEKKDDEEENTTEEEKADTGELKADEAETETEETETEETEDEEIKEPSDHKQENTANFLSGFFNSIIKSYEQE